MRSFPALVAVLATAAACGAPGAHGRHPIAGAAPRCYDLPGAARFSLRVGADGAAYWIEHVITYDYDGNSHGTDQLVRMDRTTGATSIIASGVAAPFRLLHDGRILYKATGDTSSIVLYAPAGGTRTLTPADVDVSHFELTPDERTVAFAAQNSGGKSIYAVDVASGTPRWLVDADEVYTADATTAIVAKDRTVQRVPLAGGNATAIATFDSTQPYDVIAGYIIHYDETHFWARPLSGGPSDDRQVLGPPGGWQMTGAPDHVFLTKHEGGVGKATRIEGATARALPELGGGLALDGAEPVDGEILALVAQDTDHDGSPDGARDEVDVCELPATGSVTLPVRHVPRRIAAGEAKLDAIAKAQHATWQVIEDAPGPMTVELHLGTKGGDDLVSMRARVREAAEPILAALGDPELRVDLLFTDGRRATSYTDEAQHRRITAAGIGEVVIGDPGDYDLEVMRYLIVRDDKQKQITCSGEVKNRTSHPLAAVAACAAGHTVQPVAVTPSPLPPGAIGLYAGSLPDAPDGELTTSFKDGTTQLTAFDDSSLEGRTKLYAAAAQAYDRSQLTLWSWNVDDGAVTADVDPPTGFADFSNTAQEVAATAAFDALAAPLRAVANVAPSAPVTLRIHLADGEIMDYDGELHAPRQP
jgi:hypothetical protein